MRRPSSCSRRAAGVAALTLLLLLSPAPSQAQTPATAGFGESVDVEVVNVDVVVTDRGGARVFDLGRDDFELLVDGKARAIEYFSAPRRPGRDESAPVDTAAGAAAAAPASPASLLVFVDVSALEARTTNELLDQIRAFVMTRAEGGDRVLLAAFADSLRVLAPGASDFATLDRAFTELDELRGRGTLIAADRKHLEQEIRMSGQNRTSPGSDTPAVDSQALLTSIDRFADEEVQRQRLLMSALRLWVSTFAGVEGRKSLLLATPGFSANPASYLYELADMVGRSNAADGQLRRGSLQTTEVEIYREFEKLLLQAQDARIAVYSMAPREAPPGSNSAEFGSLGTGVPTVAPRDEAIVEQGSSLARLSEATGGSKFVIDASLGERMESISDDAVASYSLGFTTGPAAGNERHTIEVKVKREGLAARNREAYRRHSFAERMEEALRAAAQFDLVNRAMELRLEAGEATPGKKKGVRSVPIALRIPIGALALTPDKRGATYRTTLSVRLAVADEKGTVNLGEPTPVEIAVPAADLERARGSAWVHRVAVDLGAGPHRVAALVVEPASGGWATVASAVAAP